MLQLLGGLALVGLVVGFLQPHRAKGMLAASFRRPGQAMVATLFLVGSVATANAQGGPPPPPPPPEPQTAPPKWRIDGENGSLSEKSDKAHDGKAQSTSWSVDGASGTFSDTVPITVPAFHRIAPALSFNYDSSSQNGWMGVGWRLAGLSQIERATPGKGAPKYDATDIYLLDGVELIPCGLGIASASCSSGGTHSAKLEDYQKITLDGTGVNSRWTVIAKDGTKHIYAPTYLVNGSDAVFRWSVNQVVDTKSNTVTYNWARDTFGCCWDYLDSVTYSGTSIKLHYEERPDREQQAVGHDALATVMGRIKTIDVSVGGSRLRAYKLGYTTSAATSRSLLSSIQQFGRDATLDPSGTVTGGTSLPAITATYNAGNASFTAGNNDVAMGASDTSRYLALDINGDGKTDMLEFFPQLLGGRCRKSWISNGTSFEPGPSTCGGMANNVADTHLLSGDFNGDGKSDFIEIYPIAFNVPWGRRLWISNGTSFELASTTQSQGGYSPNFIAMDIDGDGKTDLLEAYSICLGVCTPYFATWISTGTGFTLASNASGASTLFDDDTQLYAADINGDGKSDLLEIYRRPLGLDGGRRIWLSTGSGFVAGASDTQLLPLSPRTCTDKCSHVLMMDVNGDGKTDMVELHPSGLFRDRYTRRTWLSTGYSFTLASSDTMPADDFDRQVTTDINGDGKTDLIALSPAWFIGGAEREIWKSTGAGFVSGGRDTAMANYSCSADHGGCGSQFLAMNVPGAGLQGMVELYAANFGFNRGRRVWTVGAAQSFPDLLSSRTNEWGGTTTVAYTPSAAWPNTNNPAILQTTTGVTVDDGRGTKATTTYSYSGGVYDSAERRFMGFRYQKATHPCIAGEISCPYTETWYRQDYGAATKPERIERRSGGGALLTSTIHEYTTNGQTVPWTGLLTGTWEQTYVGSGAACPGTDCKRTYRSTSWSAFGEPVQEVEYGDYDVKGDERTTATTYVANTTAYIVNRPAVIKKFEGVGTDGTLINETRSYYDGAETENEAPSAGLETKTGRWLSGASDGEVSGGGDDGGGGGGGGSGCSAGGGPTPPPWAWLAPLLLVFVTSRRGRLMALCLLVAACQDAASTAADAATVDPYSYLFDQPSKFVETRKEYDSWGNVTAEINALGARTSYAFDEPYHVLKISETNALGQTVHTTWDQACWLPTTTTDLNGQITTLTYDPLCRLSEKTAPAGKFERHQWVNLGNAATQYEQIERPAADGTSHPNWTRDHRDGLQRIWRVVKQGPDAKTGDIYVDTAFNAREKVATRTLPYYWVSGQEPPRTYATASSYDALDRLTQTTYPDGASQTKSYGLWSETTADELGHAKTDHKSAYGKVIAHDENFGGEIKTATYLHDLRDHLVESTDPGGNAIRYKVDSLGRKIQIVDPDWGTWRYAYDDADRPIAQADAKGQLTKFEHDALDRRISKTTHDGTVSWAFDEVRSGYFNIGKRTTMTDGAGTQTFDYDALGHVVQTVRTIDGTSYTFRSGFDAGDRVLWTTYPDGDTLGTAEEPLRYDSAGRLAKVPGYVTAALYDAAGKLVQITNANGTVTTRQHSPERNFVMGITTTSGGTTMIQNLAYTRDAKGLVTGVTSPIESESWSYVHDDLEQLTHAKNPTSSNDDQSFTYDGMGNILSSTRFGDYSYDQAHPHAATRAGENTYAYDAAGLMTSGAGRTLAWNADNRLASVTTAATTLTFTYDADGARIQQVEGGTTHRYLGDDYEVTLPGAVAKYLSIAGSLVARKDGTTTYWVHTDHVGSIQAETDASGHEVHRKKYRPFGEILSTGGTPYEPRGFTGQRHDAGGLIYLHARYYDPTLGRFISPDPTIPVADNIGLNRYAYAANDPIDRTDIDGLSPKKENPPPGPGPRRDGEAPSAQQTPRHEPSTGPSGDYRSLNYSPIISLYEKGVAQDLASRGAVADGKGAAAMLGAILGGLRGGPVGAYQGAKKAMEQYDKVNTGSQILTGRDLNGDSASLETPEVGADERQKLNESRGIK